MNRFNKKESFFDSTNFLTTLFASKKLKQF